jgi:hypothetical protein
VSQKCACVHILYEIAVMAGWVSDTSTSFPPKLSNAKEGLSNEDSRTFMVDGTVDMHLVVNTGATLCVTRRQTRENMVKERK